MPNAEHRSLKQGEIPSSPVQEQKFSLLRNKLFIPPLRPERVRRPRLNQQLQSGLSKALTLVSAPAGYGKTTLVSCWLHEAGTPFAWVSLDENDNDSVRFLHYLTAAIQTVMPPGRCDLSGLLQRPLTDGFSPLLNLLIDEIAENAKPFVLVLDDFHVLQVQQTLSIFAYLLERLPVQMHLVILTRIDPPLPLARLRGQGQLVEIRADDLSFTEEEAADFLKRVMGLSLSADEVAALEERTEGWIAGLQLAAIAVQDREDLHASVSAFAGSHYYIIDYLTEEALNQQPEQVRAFLLRTSILSNLCGPLCEAVVGLEAEEPGTGQGTLELLERMNLFIIPLDEQRQWYRYHHLFADVLQIRLERQFPTLVPELHRRASAWYERSENHPEAIRHALKAGDPAHAADLIEQNGCTLILSGESYTLLKWVEAVDAYARERPWLATLKAWALALTGDAEPVESILQTTERMLSSASLTDEVRIVRGSIATIRAYLANARAEPLRAAAFAREALDTLSGGNEFSCSLRSVATLLYGDASWMNGSLEDAQHAYVEAVKIARTSGNLYTTLIAQTDLAEVLAAQGKLRQAAGIFQAILQAAQRPNGQILPLADRTLLEMGKISYEWNDLAAARDGLHQCVNLCRQWGILHTLAEGMVMLARWELAQGALPKAEETLEIAEQLAHDPRLSVRQSQRGLLKIAHAWILQGKPSRAEQLLRQVQPPGETLPDSQVSDEQDPGQLIRIRLLLAHGEYPEALAQSDPLWQSAQTEKRTGRLIEILILRALAYQGIRDTPQAVNTLAQALELAQVEGYRRIFLDEGAPIARLIYQVSILGDGRRYTGSLTASYAAQLLPAFRVDTGSRVQPVQNLIEPLTEREIEVLKLIETGCANQEIAAALFISIPTVKRHISNIYAKLGAKNRAQAISLGKELGFFEE